MSEEWLFGRAAVVAGTKYNIMRGMSEDWFQVAAAVAGTTTTVN